MSSQSFEVVTQDLTAEFEEASVGNEGGSTDIEYEIRFDVPAGYTVNIFADGLSDDELVDIFEGNVLTNYNEEDETVAVSGDTTYQLNFSDIDADTYTFEANVTDADASDSDDIEVTDTGSASADFGDNVYVDQRGDIVNITVEMSNTDESTIQIGQEENGYSITAEVVDDDEDGVAYVEFNSFTAGYPAEEDSTVVAGDDDTDVTVVSSSGLSTNTALGGDILDATSYDLYVTEGLVGSVGSNNADARATLQLNEASVDNLQVWTAPEGIYSDLAEEDAEDIGNYINAGNLTQTDSVATGDTVVVQVQASGLEGALENRAGTATATEIYSGISLLNESQGIPAGLSFEGPPVPNQDEENIPIGALDNSNVSVIYDGANDQHFVVVDSTALLDRFEATSYSYEDGDQFTANFTVYDNSDLVEDDTSVTGNFDLEVAEAELDTNADDEIVLEAASGQEVTGETNLAPGTEIELELDSDTSGDPFVKRPAGIVQAAGTFTAVADFSENSPGSEFTAEIITVEGTDDYAGRLVDAAPEPVTDTPEPMTDTATETATEGGNATETATGGSGPGFTAALALIALVAAALLAVRRNN